MHEPRLAFLLLAPLVSLSACGDDPSAILIELSPNIVSSIDGTLGVRATVLADREPVADETVSLTIAYTDRNGIAHAIAPIEGATDGTGVLEATIVGLTWDGIGAVTAAIPSTTIEAVATFAVLDRSPPTVSITPPAGNQIRVGTDISISVRAQDEIGISQVAFESSRDFGRDRTTITSGAIDTSVGFDFSVPDGTPIGTMVTLYALATDLSGNIGAASPLTITVVP